MNKDEYIAVAIYGIKNKRLRKQTADEINSHICDRIQYYKDCGLNDEEAEEKAMSRMGDPESVYRQLASLHTRAFDIFFQVIFVIFGISLAALRLLYALLDTSEPERYVAENGIFETFALCLCIGAAIFANRRPWKRTYAVMSVIFFIITAANGLKAVISLIYHYIIAMAAFVTDSAKGASLLASVYDEITHVIRSPIITDLYVIVTGKAHVLAEMYKLKWVEINSIPVSILSIAFYVLLSLFIFGNCSNVFRLYSTNASKKDNKINRRYFIKLMCVAVCVIVVFIFGWSVRLFSYYRTDEVQNCTGFYIVEADSPHDLGDEELDGARFVALYRDEVTEDVLNHIVFQVTDEEVESYADACDYSLNLKGVRYYCFTVSIVHSPAKRYIAVVPAANDKGDLISAEWYDAHTTDIIKRNYKNCEHPQLVFEVKITE